MLKIIDLILFVYFPYTSTITMKISRVILAKDTKDKLFLLTFSEKAEEWTSEGA